MMIGPAGLIRNKIAGLEAQLAGAKEEIECLRADRDRLFVENGKWHDIPSFEYWKDAAEKAKTQLTRSEESRRFLREALRFAREMIRLRTMHPPVDKKITLLKIDQALAADLEREQGEKK